MPEFTEFESIKNFLAKGAEKVSAPKIAAKAPSKNTNLRFKRKLTEPFILTALRLTSKRFTEATAKISTNIKANISIYAKMSLKNTVVYSTPISRIST